MEKRRIKAEKSEYEITNFAHIYFILLGDNENVVFLLIYKIFPKRYERENERDERESERAWRYVRGVFNVFRN